MDPITPFSDDDVSFPLSLSYCILLIILWWCLVLYLFYLVYRVSQPDPRVPLDTKYVYERLPVVTEACTGFTARYVYLLRLAYGARNRHFFLPDATITISFCDRQRRRLSTVTLTPGVLEENHRRYLRYAATHPKARPRVNLLFVLYKRKKPLRDAVFVQVNHDARSGTIMLYSFFALQLSNNRVVGTKIGKSILCLGAGFDLSTQTFALATFGTLLGYVGPSHGLSPLETLCLLWMGMSFIFVYATVWMTCPGAGESVAGECLPKKSLSLALEVGLLGALGALFLVLSLLLLYQLIIKRHNARCSNVGFSWLISKGFPFLIIGGCTLSDLTTMIILSWPDLSPTRPSSDWRPVFSSRQEKLWSVAVSLGAVVYLLALLLLQMVLYLYGYYEHQMLPRLDFESNKIKVQEGSRSRSDSSGRGKGKPSLSASYSTYNLTISSKEPSTGEEAPTSTISTSGKDPAEVLSVSRLIEANKAAAKAKATPSPSQVNKRQSI